MYTEINFKTKKALKDAVKAGKRLGYFQPNSDVTGREAPQNGTIYLEGPHYPAPHTWYAQAEVKDGVIVKIKR
jgi:hypothetical protein